MDWGTLLFSFSGRINRAKYWGAILVLMVAMVIPLIIAASTMSTLAWIVFGLVAAATAIIGLAVATKRLHDRDKSAWWLLVFYVAPLFLAALGDAAGGAGVIFHMVSFGISIWAFVELGSCAARWDRTVTAPIPSARQRPSRVGRYRSPDAFSRA